MFSKTSKFFFYSICLIITFYSLIFVVHVKNFHISRSVHKIINHDTINHKPKYKILYWTDHYNGRRWFGDGHVFDQCEYSNCESTSDRSQYNSSEAVLFHMKFIGRTPLPSHRQPHQHWIMHIFESQALEGSYYRYNGLFNATWTFLSNSDIWTNYSHVSGGGLFKRITADTPSKHIQAVLRNDEHLRSKNKLIAWFVSNCKRTPSGRMNYVKNLQKHIPVDIYGKCGTLSCHKESYQNTECMQMVGRQYKFFLAFENSLCKDYVTEKIWRALWVKTVPIVLGAYNYSKLFPPKSYIDIKDFPSTKDLANFLYKLDQNDNLYNEYFEWRNTYYIEKHASSVCKICEYLNKFGHSRKVYWNMDSFWNRNQDCYKPQQFYTTIKSSEWTISETN